VPLDGLVQVIAASPGCAGAPVAGAAMRAASVAMANGRNIDIGTVCKGMASRGKSADILGIAPA
jgi:hypothetical protein